MITDQDIAEIIVNARLGDPELPWRMARARKQSHTWTERRLVLVAAAHPARRAVSAGRDEWAMANRPDLLRRLARVLRTRQDTVKIAFALRLAVPHKFSDSFSCCRPSCLAVSMAVA